MFRIFDTNILDVLTRTRQVVTTSRLRVNYVCLFLIIAVDKLDRITCVFS